MPQLAKKNIDVLVSTIFSHITNDKVCEVGKAVIDAVVTDADVEETLDVIKQTKPKSMTQSGADNLCESVSKLVSLEHLEAFAYHLVQTHVNLTPTRPSLPSPPA